MLMFRSRARCGCTHARPRCRHCRRPHAGERLFRAEPRLRHRVDGADDRLVARERMGALGGSDDAVVDVEQRNEHDDALQRQRRQAGADRRRPGRPDGHRVQRHGGRLRRDAERQDRLGAVPVLDRGRHDPRLVSERERDDRDPRRRPLEPGRRLQGPRHDERPAVRDRLPQRPRRRVRRVVQPGAARRRLPGQEAAEGLRAVRHPGARREHLRHVREAGLREERRRRGAGRTGTSTSSRRTGRSSRASPRAGGRTLRRTRRGGSRSRRRLRRVRRRRARRQLRERPHQRVPAARRARGCTRASCALGDGTLLTLDGLWAIAFGNGAAAGPTSTLYFLAGPGDEQHGMFGAITAAG